MIGISRKTTVGSALMIACALVGTTLGQTNADKSQRQQANRHLGVASPRTSAVENDKVNNPSRPVNAEAHNEYGFDLGMAGDLDGAIREFDLAITQSAGKFPEAHYNLAIALMDKGDLQGAEREFRTAIQQDEDFAEAHDSLGIVLAKLSRIPDAVSEFERALSLAGGIYADAHYNLGIALFQSGETDRAMEQFRNAIEQRDNFPEAHYNLGVALASIGRNHEASIELEKYLLQAVDPKDGPEVRKLMANLRGSAGKL